ncbi:hypothetical protein MY11210_007511 [Beauveria gryllotalpidicola]
MDNNDDSDAIVNALPITGVHIHDGLTLRNCFIGLELISFVCRRRDTLKLDILVCYVSQRWWYHSEECSWSKLFDQIYAARPALIHFVAGYDAAVWWSSNGFEDAKATRRETVSVLHYGRTQAASALSTRASTTTAAAPDELEDGVQEL